MNDLRSKKEFIALVNATIELLMSQKELSAIHVAAELKLQPQQLRRLITSITGQSSSEYIANYRIMRAKQMLLDHDMLAITKIGYMCGYEEPTHFTRFFKQHVGMTPGEFRKRGCQS